MTSIRVCIPMYPVTLAGMVFQKDELWVCPYCRSLIVYEPHQCRNCGAPYTPQEDHVVEIQAKFDGYFERRKRP